MDHKKKSKWSSITHNILSENKGRVHKEDLAVIVFIFTLS